MGKFLHPIICIECSHANTHLVQFCPFNQHAWMSLEFHTKTKRRNASWVHYWYLCLTSESCAHHMSTDINPKDLVPAIEYWGKALYELLILCESAYPNHKSHLYPTLLHWQDVSRSYSRGIGSEGLRPQLVRCAPFPSIAPYFRILYVSYPKIRTAIVVYPKVWTTIVWYPGIETSNVFLSEDKE
jgi:hypothetical protein